MVRESIKKMATPYAYGMMIFYIIMMFLFAFEVIPIDNKIMYVSILGVLSILFYSIYLYYRLLHISNIDE